MPPAPLVVLDVGGLTGELLLRMPRLRALGEQGFQAALRPQLPALPAPAQATFLTGLPPGEHGIVAGSWYDRERGQLQRGTAARGLLAGTTLWEELGHARTLASLGWSFGLGAGTGITVTPLDDAPDVYTTPAILHDRLAAEFGPWPGDRRDRRDRTAWMAGAARHVLETDAPSVALVSLPLPARAPQQADQAVAQVAETARERGATVVVLSGYGLATVWGHVDLNETLHAEGLQERYRAAGEQRPDPWTSRAFALPDHQVAHVYVRQAADVAPVARLLGAAPGVAEVLDAPLAHARAGELLAVAEPGTSFAPVPASAVSYGRADPGPVLLCSDRSLARGELAVTEVRVLLLEAATSQRQAG